MTKILVIEPQKSIKQKIKSALERQDISAEFVSKDLDATYEAIQTSRPDVVLLDLEFPKMDALTLLRNIKQHAPEIPVILLAAGRLSGAVHRSMGHRDRLLKKPIKEEKLLSYINTLIEHRPRDLSGQLTPSITAPLTAHWVPELHDPVTGRLNASMVASYLRVPLSTLAEAIGKKVATVHKSPATTSLQESLAPIARSISILLRFLGSRERVVAWLNSPHPDLGNRSPLSVILGGKANAVAEMLEAVLAGQAA